MALANQAARPTNSGSAASTKKTAARLPIISLLLAALSAIGLAVTIWMIFDYAPMDALQGEPERIFYFHVPTAWLAMLSFCILALAGIAYLFKPDERLDWIARASAEVGLVFLTTTLFLGSLWGKPIWGAWWVWDPKLTACLILWFMYVGYLMMRSYWGRTHDSARGGAVIGIVGVIDVPIIYLSVLWWRGQHPLPMSGYPPAAILTLMVALTSFTLLFAFLMIQAYQLQRLQTLAQRLRSLVE
jgi:heme exporter protein C